MVNALDEMIRGQGGRLLYTPPFCPRANAAEDFFKAMNDFICRHKDLALSHPEDAILEGLLAVGPTKGLEYVLQSERKVRSWAVKYAWADAPHYQ